MLPSSTIHLVMLPYLAARTDRWDVATGKPSSRGRNWLHNNAIIRQSTFWNLSLVDQKVYWKCCIRLWRPCPACSTCRLLKIFTESRVNAGLISSRLCSWFACQYFVRNFWLDSLKNLYELEPTPNDNFRHRPDQYKSIVGSFAGQHDHIELLKPTGADQ